MKTSSVKSPIVLFFGKSLIVLFLALGAFISLRTAMPKFSPDLGGFVKFQLMQITEHLDLYFLAQGNYPENLNDIPDFPHYYLNDPWEIPFHYEKLDEGDKYILASIGYDQFHANDVRELRTQNRIRIGRHIIATGCMALLIFIILFIRWQEDGRWLIWKSLPLLISFVIGLYARLGDNGILPMGGSVYVFYTLLIIPSVLGFFAFLLAIIKHDSLYFAALPIALYAHLSVFLLSA